MGSSVLGRLERLLENLVEGVFGRDANSLPAAILRRLAAEIEREATSRGGRRWAPPDCRILLTREAARLILPIQAELEEELRAALGRLAAQAGLCFPGPLRFRFSAGDGEGVAVISVRAVFPTPPPDGGEAGAETGPTKIFRRRPASPGPRAYLRVVSGSDAGREFPLLEGSMEIGRRGASHVCLRDPSISRRHAAIVYERGAYYLRDLGSTNGTVVNDQQKKRHRLKNGDRITLGHTMLVYKSDAD
ncbi:MAG: FhaA domain-containing protein [Patescibacteria group bacterium]